MYFLFSCLSLLHIAPLLSVSGASSVSLPAAGDVARDLSASFIANERARALQGILANIGPNGSLSQGAASGVVIASPSTVNPDYLYTWTRDSALTIKTLVDELIFTGNRNLQTTIQDYIHAQAVLQTVSNPSGSLYNGAGLGEPKFLIDLVRFNEPWGRPQRDGPALRAIALMSYVWWLLERNELYEAKYVVWPIISNDLNYVGQYWNQTGYDLWEEVDGSSFFTIINQNRALTEGAALASELGLLCLSCESQAPEILCFLQSFWNGTSIVANINTQTVRSGRDANTLLGAIATFDIQGRCDDASLQPCNSKILASHKVLVDSFRSIYPINANATEGKAAAVGRYPEDVYYNGNPWYLCTLAAAEVLYDAVFQWRQLRQLTVDDISYAFFKDLYPSVKKKTYVDQEVQFSEITSAVTKYADGFVSIVQQYLPPNGSISEEFDKATGQPLSAYDLTWSFASFVTMSQRRSGQLPPTWGIRYARPPPPTCSGTSFQGTYAPAVAAGAPNNTNGCEVTVTFNVNATTYYGENIYLIGNTTDLGAWNPANADPMSAANYTSARPLWSLSIGLLAGEFIDYQYLRQESDGSYIYETVNRTLAVPACGQPGPVTNDAWTGPT